VHRLIEVATAGRIDGHERHVGAIGPPRRGQGRALARHALGLARHVVGEGVADLELGAHARERRLDGRGDRAWRQARRRRRARAARRGARLAALGPGSSACPHVARGADRRRG
jgi:hypothetical protein